MTKEHWMMAGAAGALVLLSMSGKAQAAADQSAAHSQDGTDWVSDLWNRLSGGDLNIGAGLNGTPVTSFQAQTMGWPL